MKPELITRLGLIAGNGRFPFLLLDAARAHGAEVVVAAIKEETDPEMDARAAADPGIRVYWLSLGELSRLIETFRQEGISHAVMAGQVKHKQIFSSIRPDWRLAKLLLNLRTRNTDMLLGAVAKVLSDEGIELISSTAYLEPLLARPGVLTARSPLRKSNRIWPMGARWPSPSLAMTLARPWSWQGRPVWPSRPWRAPMPPSNAPGPFCGLWRPRVRHPTLGTAPDRGQGGQARRRTCVSMCR